MLVVATTVVRFRPGLAALPAICAVALSACTGCWRCPAPSEVEYQHGLVWMFPGIEGGQWQLEAAHRAFRDAGVAAAIVVHEWQTPGIPLNSLPNLIDEPRNRRRAREVAATIAAYAAEHPHAPVDLVGYSGGGGLAIMVAEALPESARLRHVILCQAAISPTYDLTCALERTRGSLVNFYSPPDWVILGLGTSLFGTMDRRFEASAGRDGFRLPAAAPDPRQRHLIEQCDASQTHYGGHYGVFSYEWNKRRVAPYLVDARGEAGP